MFVDTLKPLGMSQLRDSTAHPAMVRLPHAHFGQTRCHFVSSQPAMKKHRPVPSGNPVCFDRDNFWRSSYLFVCLFIYSPPPHTPQLSNLLGEDDEFPSVLHCDGGSDRPRLRPRECDGGLGGEDKPSVTGHHFLLRGQLGFGRHRRRGSCHPLGHNDQHRTGDVLLQLSDSRLHYAGSHWELHPSAPRHRNWPLPEGQDPAQVISRTLCHIPHARRLHVKITDF